MPRRALHRSGPISEINMTPLIDLTFLLLITFVITFPLVQLGIPVNLPRGGRKDLPTDNKRTITVDVRGNLFLDNAATTEPRLTSEMKALGRSRPDTTILVRADEGVAYGKVVAVLRILNDANLTRMALVTRGDDRRAP